MKRFAPDNVRMISLIAYGVGALTALLGFLLNVRALIVIGLGVILAAIIFHGIFYRCPHCGEYLDRKKCEFCPACGEKLN